MHDLEIGDEMHQDVDQFFRIEQAEARFAWYVEAGAVKAVYALLSA